MKICERIKRARRARVILSRIELKMNFTERLFDRSSTTNAFSYYGRQLDILYDKWYRFYWLAQSGPIYYITGQLPPYTYTG